MKKKVVCDSSSIPFGFYPQPEIGSEITLRFPGAKKGSDDIQALGFPNSPRKLGLYEKPRACMLSSLPFFAPGNLRVISEPISG